MKRENHSAADRIRKLIEEAEAPVYGFRTEERQAVIDERIDTLRECLAIVENEV